MESFCSDCSPTARTKRVAVRRRILDHHMLSLNRITTSPALTFDALVAGEPGAPLVLLLHGFAESMQCWRAGEGC